MNPWRWLKAALLCAPMAAAAQAPLIEPSVALGCLTPGREARGVPEYPFESWKLGHPGRVRVELEFTGPDRKPDVQIVSHEGDEGFVGAVKSHVRQFRVPCIDKGATKARIAFDYVFKPDDRKAVTGEAFDLDHEAFLKQVQCLRHLSGKRAPEYPTDARRREIQGRIYTELQFSAADQPPKATVLSADNRGVLHDAIEDWARGYRMPCYQGPATVSLSQTYVYVLDGVGGYGFKPVSFVQFLGAVRDIRKQQVNFDFTQMACPFDVRMTYLQPHRDNWVGQLDNYSPTRQPFIEWLKRVQLELPRRTLQAIYADTLTLTIPCTRLALNVED